MKKMLSYILLFPTFITFIACEPQSSGKIIDKSMFIAKNDYTGIDYQVFINANNDELLLEKQKSIVNNKSIEPLMLSTGVLVAQDPFFTDRKPFKIKIRPGKYPVQLTIIRFPSGDQRIALSSIIVQNKQIRTWKLADVDNPKITKYDNENAYGVDSGTGCFMDFNIAKRHHAKLIQDKKDNYQYSDYLNEYLYENCVNTYCWKNYLFDKKTKENIITFTSGWGDGVYYTYIGYDNDNNISLIVTDFGVIDSSSLGSKLMKLYN